MGPTQEPLTPAVSVVICTRNRDDKIINAVRSVLANEHPSYELIVVDQSSTDATWRAIEQVVANDPRLRYIHSELAGLSRAYNTGIEHSRGALLAFTDDDCVAGPEWISSIAAAFDAEHDAELLYGSVVALGTSADDIIHTPAYHFISPERLSKREGFRIVGMGANFAARRSLFDRVGPFDNVLGGGGPLRSSQDYDIEYRTICAGGVVLLRPDVVVRHDGRREPEDWPSLMLAYGTGDGAFYTKHIRCRDPRAVWLLGKQVSRTSGRWIIRRLRGEKPTDHIYLRGVLTGVRGSLRFGVDRSKRLYVEP